MNHSAMWHFNYFTEQQRIVGYHRQQMHWMHVGHFMHLLHKYFKSETEANVML